MHSSYGRVSLSPDPLPPRQNKMILQRQYREKEGECFNALRDVIKQLTGEEPQTRYEILTKAIELLSLREIRHVRREPNFPVQPEPLPAPPLEVFSSHEDTLPHTDYSIQSSQWPWQSAAEFDPAYYSVNANSTSFQLQPYQIMSDTNAPGGDISSQGFEGGWPANH